MNTFSGLGDDFDRERRPDGGFEAADVRGKVFCEDDGFRSDRKLSANFVLNPQLVLNVKKEAHGTSKASIIAGAETWTLILVN